MPAIVKRLTNDGLRNVNYRADSLNSAEDFEARDGVYTVSNTYNVTQTLLLDAHLDRLEDSARRQGFVLLCDRARLRAALRELVVSSGFGDVRFRISSKADAPASFLLTIEPYQPPTEQIRTQGARCVTTDAASRSDPAAKTSGWMHRRKALQADMPAGIYEAFLRDEKGQILEGMTSNFYAVLGGQLHTAGDGVLAGISRRIVLDVCRDVLQMRMQAPSHDDIANFREAFLSSSSRGIIPVVEIDGLTIGDGAVGANTRILQRLYQSWVEAHLEEL